MNEQSLQLLRELSETLETTTEHLWSVLVKQAYISGLGDLMVYGVVIWGGIIIFRKIKSIDFKDKELAVIIKAFYWVIMAISVLFIADSLPTTFASFFNPEYWALSQILNK